MLNLLELAKKWFALNAAGHTPEEPGEIAEREAFNKRVGELWLAYHDQEPWAKVKLAAGLRLTPEAVVYMEREVTARKLAEAARLKNLEPDNDQNQNSAVSGDQRSSTGGSDRAEPAGSIPQGS